ncbi:hypothetical protein X801_08633, partial [Opisthorchis viverrini]
MEQREISLEEKPRKLTGHPADEYQPPELARWKITSPNVNIAVHTAFARLAILSRTVLPLRT